MVKEMLYEIRKITTVARLGMYNCNFTYSEFLIRESECYEGRT